ncbi:MAG TPA: hypothetical protein VKP30_03530, partial [Polyangiaceae bacterium]|nr:hypothetical protein [Polyangiaceae bacterium]
MKTPKTVSVPPSRGDSIRCGKRRALERANASQQCGERVQRAANVQGSGSSRNLAAWFVAGFVLFGACTPLRDLDQAAAGGDKGGAKGSTRSTANPTNAGGTEPATNGTATGGSGGTPATAIKPSTSVGGATPKSPSSTVPSGGTSMSPLDTSSGGGGSSSTGGTLAFGGATADTVGGKTGAGGTTASGATTGTGGTNDSAPIAPDLPDLPNSPVQGEITYSSGASWDIDGVQAPAYRIETPTATYFLVKDAAAIVSIDDENNMPWIAFSSGYRPNRGVPNLGGCCQPGNP